MFARYVSVVEERRGACKVLIRKPKEKRSLGRHRRRWEDTIKVGLKEVVWYMDWRYPAQNRDRCECCNGHSGSIMCGKFLD
jgi:hypothetical protein